MRLAAVSDGQRNWIGLVNPAGTHIREIQLSCDKHRDPAIEFLCTTADDGTVALADTEVALDTVQLLPPVRWPSKNVICVGKNYRDHAAEFAGSGYDSSAVGDADSVPDEPILFSKAACTLVGAHDDIRVPWKLSSEIDYEAELGLVIGKPGRDIPLESAFEHTTVGHAGVFTSTGIAG